MYDHFEKIQKAFGGGILVGVLTMLLVLGCESGCAKTSKKQVPYLGDLNSVSVNLSNSIHGEGLHLIEKDDKARSTPTRKERGCAVTISGDRGRTRSMFISESILPSNAKGSRIRKVGFSTLRPEEGLLTFNTMGKRPKGRIVPTKATVNWSSTSMANKRQGMRRSCRRGRYNGRRPCST